MKQQRDVVQGWFKKADSDFSAAQATLNTDGPYDTVCFHAQQGAEKYLKGLLASFGQNIPFIHDLVALNALCQKHTDTLNLSEEMLSLLTDYAVEARYELDFFPDKELATKAYALAEQVRETVKAETSV